MIKDANYWKEYNQRRKEYFRLKQQEHRNKLKGAVVDNQTFKKVVDIPSVVDSLKVVDTQLSSSVVDKEKVLVVDAEPKKEVVDSIQRFKNKVDGNFQNNNRPPKKLLWKDFYIGLKPHCWTCLKKGIEPNEYDFCSTEKEPTQVIINESNEKMGVFNNTYICAAYHWTIFQGQSQAVKNLCQNPTNEVSDSKNHPLEPNYSNYQNQAKI